MSIWPAAHSCAQAAMLENSSDAADDNLEAVRRELGLTDGQMATLARNSFDACFASDEDKPAGKPRLTTTPRGTRRPPGRPR